MAFRTNSRVLSNKTHNGACTVLLYYLFGKPRDNNRQFTQLIGRRCRTIERLTNSRATAKGTARYARIVGKEGRAEVHSGPEVGFEEITLDPLMSSQPVCG